MNSKKKFALFIAFLVVCVFIAIFSAYFGLNPSYIESFITINHVLAAIIYNDLFILLASFSFSVSVMTSLGALLFPWYEVVAYATIGIMIAAMVHFYISRKLGREYVRNYLEKRGGKLEKFDEIVEKNTFKTILILSAVFFVPPTIPNMLGGVIKISSKKYFVATFLGNFPNTFFTVYLIHGLSQSNNLQVYGSIGGLVLTTLIGLYFYKGEIRDVLKLSFPWAFGKKEN